jgi:hypothetical protein
MQAIWCNVAVLTVALIFYVWRTHQTLRQQRRQRLLRQRVAYMLWVMADQQDNNSCTDNHLASLTASDS